MSDDQDDTILDKLDSVAAPLAKFDAFPKLEPTYKARSESRGFFTIFVALFAFFLLLGDIGEYIWGWPDHEFSVDNNKRSFMRINIDMTVAMPCGSLSVDLRDAVGDRLMLSTNARRGVRRDGTTFDVGQATALKAHSEALSARQAISQSRRSRGFFSTLFRNRKPEMGPTYNHQPDGSACRIYGAIEVKKVTANLHITALGHGYASYEHVDHNQMNLSHVITEFSFGPYFPDITQPLDYSYEATDEPFIAYQYFLHVVPTTYIAPRSSPLHTNQYSVTHYTRVIDHGQGTPGIFFKFDLDPLTLTIHQRTSTLLQLIIRCVGVIGGVFVCMGYAVRITSRAVDVVSGADKAAGIVAAESSGAKVGLRQKWAGGSLRARTTSGRMIRQGNGWVLEGTPGTPNSPFPGYAGTPLTGGFGTGSPMAGQYASPGLNGPSTSSTPNVGLGFSSFGPAPSAPPRTPSIGTPRMNGATLLPGTPAHSNFPPTPNPLNGGGFNVPPSGPPRRVSGQKKDD